MKGKIEEARAVVFKLHTIKGDPDQEFARGEFYQMSKQAELDRTYEPGWVSNTKKRSFRGHTDRPSDRNVPKAKLQEADFHGHGICFHWPVNR
jgi:hypothetical protein